MCDLCGDNPSDTVIDHSITHPFALLEGSDMDCAECGQHVSRHPDKMDFLAKQTMERIAKYGHEVRTVFPNEGDEGTCFAYSIGRAAFDRPELLIYGNLPPTTMGYIINQVAALDDGSLCAGRELDEVIQQYRVRLVDVHDLEEAEMFGVTDHFSDATALQILWPDPEGNFPGDADYDADKYVQPTFC